MNGKLSAETSTEKLRGLYLSHSDIQKILIIFLVSNLAIVLIPSSLSFEPNVSTAISYYVNQII